jgi:uncharacterized membrane protein YdjX (TVP38/TMEM64 family)
MKELDRWMSQLLDRVSDYIAARRGMPVFVAVALLVISFVLRLFPGIPLIFSDIFLYLGIIVGFIGLLLGEAL